MTGTIQEPKNGTELAKRNEHAAPARASEPAPAPARGIGGVIPFDPFALMDRLDAATFMAEMEGVASDVLVYRIKDGGKETVGLSKGGVDECCTMLVSQGQCIREENLKFEFFGDGEDKEAIFQVTAARFAVSPDGREVRLDQVLGVKREPLYEMRAPLTLDSKVAGKKWRRLTYLDALENEQAREYLEWIVDGSTFDEDTKRFVALILNGEDVEEFSMGKRFNNFWFEHGAMKAARNARFRLIPAGLKAQVVALAKATARVKEVARAETEENTPAPPTNVQAATREKLADNAANARTRDARDEHRREPDRKPYVFPFGTARGTPLDLRHPPGHEHAGAYVVSDEMLRRACKWTIDCLDGKPFARPGATDKTPITDAERPKFEASRDAYVEELEERRKEASAKTAARAETVPGGDEPGAVSSGAPEPNHGPGEHPPAPNVSAAAQDAARALDADADSMEFPAEY